MEGSDPLNAELFRTKYQQAPRALVRGWEVGCVWGWEEKEPIFKVTFSPPDLFCIQIGDGMSRFNVSFHA